MELLSITLIFVKSCNRSTTRTQSQRISNRKIETKMEENGAIVEQSKFRSEFLQILRSRRPPQVPLTVEIAKPVTNPTHQNASLSTEEQEVLNSCSKIDIENFKEQEVLKSCPKKEVENFKDLLKEENLFLTIEEGDQGRLPLLILSLKEIDKQRRRPAVVFIHGICFTGIYSNFG